MGRSGALVAGALIPLPTLTPAHIGADLLLDLQIWCWGRDILMEEGNLLVQHGFTRTVPSSDGQGPSLYRLDLPFGGRVVLRGFGVFYGERGIGSVFIQRGTFHPLVGTPASWALEPWAPEAMAQSKPPKSIAQFRRWSYLTLVLIRWIGFYESWVAQRTPRAYRHEVVRAWEARGRPIVEPAHLALAWSGVEDAVATRPELFTEGLADRSRWATTQGRGR